MGFLEEYIKAENKNYSNPECRKLQPYIPNFDKMYRLGTRYFYDPEIYKFLECYAESITIDPESGILGENRLISQFVEGNIIASGISGTTFSFNRSIVVKTSHTKNLNEKEINFEEDVKYLENALMKEFIVGKVLNSLDLPNFVRTFGIIKAPKPTEMSNYIKIIGKEKRIGNYLMLEFIKGHPFRYYIREFIEENDFHAIIVCFLQIFYTLWIAFHHFKFIHGDLHDLNILMIKMSSPVNIPYFLPNGDIVVLTTPYVIKIIDFGISIINVPLNKELEKKYGKNKRIYVEGYDTETQPMGKNLNTPFFDLFKISQNILIGARKNKELFKLLTVVFGYIAFLKRYYDERREPKEEVFLSKKTIDEYGALTKKMAKKAEKTLSLEGFHGYLNWVLYDYLKVKYVNLNEPNKLNPKTLWITCKGPDIHKLESKGYKGMHICRSDAEAKKELEYHFTTLNTIADYMKRENLSKEQLLKQFPHIEQTYNTVIKEIYKQLDEISHKRISNDFEFATAKMILYKIDVYLISITLLRIKLHKNENEIQELKKKAYKIKNKILDMY